MAEILPPSAHTHTAGTSILYASPADPATQDIIRAILHTPCSDATLSAVHWPAVQHSAKCGASNAAAEWPARQRGRNYCPPLAGSSDGTRTGTPMSHSAILRDASSRHGSPRGKRGTGS